MTPHKTAEVAPIFVSVTQAAAMLSLSRWSVDKLCKAGTIESRWHGNRRLVDVESIRVYAESLPTERPTGDVSP